jgi:hypothetical protein
MKLFLNIDKTCYNTDIPNKIISFISERGHDILNISDLKDPINSKTSVIFENSLGYLKKSDFVVMICNIPIFDHGFICAHSVLNLQKKTLLLYNQKYISRLSDLVSGCTLNNFYLKQYKNINEIKTTLTLFNL